MPLQTPEKGDGTISEKKRQDDNKRKRQHQIIIRFSDEELAGLNEVTEQSGMSRTEFFLKLMQNSNIVIISDLQAICIELKKQGVNLNQALRFAYQIGDTEELKQTIKKCNDLYEQTKKLCLATESKTSKSRKGKL